MSESGELLPPLDLLPWERQPRESEQGYRAFEAYLEGGAERSHAKVAAELGKSINTVKDMSRDHDWVARSAEYDRHLAREKRRAAEAEIVRMAGRQAQTAAAMQAVGVQGINAIGVLIRRNQREAAATYPDDLEAQAVMAAEMFPLPADLVLRFVEVGQRLERQARGEPDETIKVGVGPALDPVARAIVTDPDVRKAARELVERAAKARAKDRTLGNGRLG